MSDNVPPGLILLHKRPGITSFDALRDIKRALNTGKAGHTGTLDKFAEGLLLVLTGRALKLSQWFTHLDKQYEGIMCFGAETDTLDPEGAVIANAPLPDRGAVESALVQFSGEIEQAPPAYSAIHIDGERASALARRGDAPVMRKRPVHIHRLELLSWEPPHARIFVHCSSGTYIRSLARDIALAAGSRAYLTALVRTRVAGFKLEDAKIMGGPSDFSDTAAFTWPTPYRICSSTRSPVRVPFSGGSGEDVCIHPIDRNVFHSIGITCLDISPADAAKIRTGKPLELVLHSVLQNVLQNVVALFSGDELIAIIERSDRSDNQWKYGYVYAHN